MGNIFSATEEEHQGKEKKSCNIYQQFRSSQNLPFLGIHGYEGIPQNLTINLAVWLIMLILFILLRKKAWNYGRIAVMKKDEIKWTDMFYEDLQDDLISIAPDGSSSGRVPIIIASAKSKWYDSDDMQDMDEAPAGSTRKQPRTVAFGKAEFFPHLYKGKRVYADRDSQNNFNQAAASEHTRFKPIDPESPVHQKIQISEIKDKGYFSWIKTIYKLTDEQYVEKVGEDCVHYLSFQRHLIVIAAIMTLVCLFLILPLNMVKSFKEDKFLGFVDTTIVNLAIDHYLLWSHVVLAIAFLFVSIIVMRHFSRRLQISRKNEKEKAKSKAILITGISKRNCSARLLKKHFAETYPGAEITEISFAYKISKLKELEFKRLCAASAKLYYLHKLDSSKSSKKFTKKCTKKCRKKLKKNKRSRKRFTIRPYTCGICNCNCCGICKETDAIDYYTEQERKLTEKVEAERRRAVTQPVGVAFVTFQSLESSEAIVDDYGVSGRACLQLQTPVSKYSKRLNSKSWAVQYAPHPEELHWENLTVNYKVWYLKFVVVNLIVAILVIIFTTPVYIFSTFVGPNLAKHSYHVVTNDTHGHTSEIEGRINELVNLLLSTLPPIIVCVLGAALIAVVSQSDSIIGFWTRSSGSRSEMIKTYFFLTFMVIALPSLGVTSFSFLFSKAHHNWSCIFFQENGALFVNYLITSGFIGTGAELMRLPELLIYAIKLSFARSQGEIAAIRKSLLLEFPIGIYYAWTALNFTIMTCFSVIYPLVTPFGLIYLILKYWTDRYNMYFAYAPCKVDRSVHKLAIYFVIMSMFLLQINLVAYVNFHLTDTLSKEVLRKEAIRAHVRSLQLFSLFVFSITGALCSGQLCFHFCSDFSPIYIFKGERSRNTSIGVPEFDNSPLPSEDRIHITIDEKLELKHILTNASMRTPLKNILSATSDELPDNTTSNSWTSSSFETDSIFLSKRRPYGVYIPPILRPEIIRLRRREANKYQNELNYSNSD